MCLYVVSITLDCHCLQLFVLKIIIIKKKKQQTNSGAVASEP